MQAQHERDTLRRQDSDDPFRDLAHLQRELLTQWIRLSWDATNVLVELQRTSLEANVRWLETANDGGRRALDTWLQSMQATQAAFTRAAERAERDVEAVERTTAARALKQTDRVAEEAEAAAARAERQSGHAQRRGE